MTPTSEDLRRIALNLKMLVALAENHRQCLSLYDNGTDLTEDVDKALAMGTDMILHVLPVVADMMTDSGFFDYLAFTAIFLDAESGATE